MANLEIQSAALGRPETRPTGIPPTEIGVIPEEVIRTLQLPSEVTPTQITQFLSLQSARLSGLQSTEPPYSLDAAIPEPPAGLFTGTNGEGLTDAEFAALEGFVADMKQGRMGGASASDDFDDFRETMEQILPELQKKAPPPGSLGEGDPGSGAVGYWISSQISALSEEREKEWADLLTKLRTDPKASLDVYLLALGYYMTESLGAKLTKTFRMFQQSTVAHEQLLAGLELDKPGGATAAEMFQAQNEQQRYMIDTQMGMQVMQSLKQDLDKIQLQIQSTVRTHHTTLSDIRRNITS